MPTAVTHKFRACLGKSRTVKPGDKVLVGFSGSANSVALLYLIKTGIEDATHKRLMIEPCIVYIDEAAALNLTTEERNNVNTNINRMLETYKYPSYTVPLELALESEEAMQVCLAGGSTTADDSTLRGLFTALTSLSAKMDMLSKLRHNALVEVAKSLGCNKVFTAETADDLAVELLTNVSLGRGAQLPYHVGFSDDRSPEVKLIRPLRDLSRKELIFYNTFNKLTSVHVPSLSTKVSSHSSIQKMTESFLCELQNGFPSTLSTVFRVADKLTTDSRDKDICSLCKAPLDKDNVPSSSLSATEYSRLVSSSGPDLNLPKSTSDSSCCGGSADSNELCHGNGLCSRTTSETELYKTLCYGCSLILKDANMEALPAHFKKHLQESNQRFKMKKEIEDFLL